MSDMLIYDTVQLKRAKTTYEDKAQELETLKKTLLDKLTELRSKWQTPAREKFLASKTWTERAGTVEKQLSPIRKKHEKVTAKIDELKKPREEKVQDLMRIHESAAVHRHIYLLRRGNPRWIALHSGRRFVLRGAVNDRQKEKSPREGEGDKKLYSVYKDILWRLSGDYDRNQRDEQNREEIPLLPMRYQPPRKDLRHKLVKKEYIENLVITKTREFLTPENIDKIASEVVALCEREYNNNDYKRLQKLLKENEKATENLFKALESGQAVDMIAERIAQKKKEWETLEQQLHMEAVQHPMPTIRDIKFFSINSARVI